MIDFTVNAVVQILYLLAILILAPICTAVAIATNTDIGDAITRTKELIDDYLN